MHTSGVGGPQYAKGFTPFREALGESRVQGWETQSPAPPQISALSPPFSADSWPATWEKKCRTEVRGRLALARCGAWGLN